MSEVECPGCGAVYELLRVQKTAEEFCPGCDYPLFWAARRDSSTPVASAGTGLGPTLRRRPGAAGLQIPTGSPCPVCRELNPPGTDWCLRCGAAMNPAPARPAPAVVTPPPPPPPAPPPPPPAPVRRSLLPIVIAVLAAVLAIQLLVLLLR